MALPERWKRSDWHTAPTILPGSMTNVAGPGHPGTIHRYPRLLFEMPLRGDDRFPLRNRLNWIQIRKKSLAALKICADLQEIEGGYFFVGGVFFRGTILIHVDVTFYP